jgi:hypothetical protein
MLAAAQCGHTELCQWLCDQGCEWDSSACSFAAAAGEVETLDWLLTNGCPCDAGRLVLLTCSACKSGNAAVFDYIEQHGLIPDEDSLSATLRHVGADNNLAAVKWLRKVGAPWPEVLQNDLGFIWQDECLEWAREQGCYAPFFDSPRSIEGEWDYGAHGKPVRHSFSDDNDDDDS